MFSFVLVLFSFLADLSSFSRAIRPSSVCVDNGLVGAPVILVRNFKVNRTAEVIVSVCGLKES